MRLHIFAAVLFILASTSWAIDEPLRCVHSTTLHLRKCNLVICSDGSTYEVNSKGWRSENFTVFKRIGDRAEKILEVDNLPGYEFTFRLEGDPDDSIVIEALTDRPSDWEIVPLWRETLSIDTGISVIEPLVDVPKSMNEQEVMKLCSSLSTDDIGDFYKKLFRLRDYAFLRPDLIRSCFRILGGDGEVAEVIDQLSHQVDYLYRVKMKGGKVVPAVVGNVLK